ncbi:SDR family NAD(P)-dependent oxidoreductase [Paenibacillus koleovorans]|uniref:SDR family NAD(P)-dependent oxidoreductase n=1 Tax=Paenibacillus koleovorans TaxID=121608 RepID=UPI000FDC3549|nr:SDR family oxidoreductase [Paenibacillus koleovorans]
MNEQPYEAVSLGLRGRKALVVGAGGIGEACVEQLIRQGVQLVLADIDQSRLDAIAELNRFDEAGCYTVRCDVRQPDDCRRLVDDTCDKLGGLDLFIHMAGINIRKPATELDDAEWRDILDINLTSAFTLTQAAGKRMVRQGYGRIVLYSSVSGLLAHKNHSPYAASKGGMNQMMRVMAHEWADKGVTVNAIAPGYMETHLTRDYLRQSDTYDKLTQLIPAGRLGNPIDVIGPTLFLLSDLARFVTGHVLYVDGGRTLV